MISFRDTVPKQHGAWITLVVCLALGTAAGSRFNLEAGLILLAVIAAFLCREALSLHLRWYLPGEFKKGLAVWITFYSLLFLLPGAALVFKYRLWFLMPLAAVGFILAALSLALERIKKDKAVFSQVVNILGLCLSAPAAEYASSGSYSLRTLAVWLICGLFFAGGIFRVRSLVRRQRRIGLGSALFHLGALSALIIFSCLEILPVYAAIVFIPALLKALHPLILAANQPPSLRRIGYGELVHSLIFLGLAIFIFKF